MTLFLRILEASVDEKPGELLRAVTALRRPGQQDAALQRIAFERAPEVFAALPGNPFAYWVSEEVRGVFGRFERLEGENRIVKQGLATRDDFRLVRLWWEIERSSRSPHPTWPSFAKGGAFGAFYSDVSLAVRWDAAAHASYAERTSNFNVLLTSSREEFLYRPGLTWPLRTNGLSFRAMPAGCIFGHKGPVAFVEGNSTERLLALSAILNSRAFGYLVSVQLARTELAQSYEVGLIQKTPVPELSDDDTACLARLARRAWSLKRSQDTANEISHAFLLPPGLNEKVGGGERDKVEKELAGIHREIDERAFTLYGVGPDDRATIEAASRGLPIIAPAEPDDETDDTNDAAPAGAAADALISWLVGVSFGRFDPRLATGERPIPPEPEPFDPLPSRSPGMWPEGEEPADLPDIRVDDDGHSDDLAGSVRAVADRVRVEVPENIRDWLAKDFFPLHIKMYSKSRRKAPIYWQLATPSASYSVWFYIHASSKDSLFRIQNDYTAPKLAHEERRLESLTKELGDKATAAQRKDLAAQEAIVEELRAFLQEVKRIAPLWNPNLDDGIVINFAPLWRLVPQNKSWQKELKSTWDALCEGKYDWADLAMHIWPERVVPKCAKDRSLAIAHGLEDMFWVEDSGSKWTPRKTSARSIDDLVRERTSPAVRAALESLIAAPVTRTANTRRKGTKP